MEFIMSCIIADHCIYYSSRSIQISYLASINPLLVKGWILVISNIVNIKYIIYKIFA